MSVVLGCGLECQEWTGILASELKYQEVDWSVREWTGVSGSGLECQGVD